MQFTQEAWGGIANGSITVTYRTWQTSRVGVGRHYRVPPGVVEVTRVDKVRAGSLTPADAQRAGAELATLRQRLAVDDDTEVWRVEFCFLGADPRGELRSRIPTGTDLDDAADEVRAIDIRAVHGPWAVRSLELIADRPGERAPNLAADIGLETLAFKQKIRRLKELGLTESLRIGYRLSPRGEAVLARLREEQ